METQRRPFFGLFVTPGVTVALLFAVAMVMVLQFSVRMQIPGSLDVGGLTFRNFTAMLHPLYARVFLDTLWLCVLTAVISLILGYPLAYALVRSRSMFVKSAILIITVTPLFLGEVVRTYSWVVVLGSNGFINSLLMKMHVVAQPLQILFTMTGVTIVLVHVTLPVVLVVGGRACSYRRRL